MPPTDSIGGRRDTLGELPTFAEYVELRASFVVTRDLAQRALAWAQPFAMEALGMHTRRQTLVDGELPAYVVTTTPETNGGWGELMPVWFKPYDRPVPLHCLDNWALFALSYRSAFGRDADLSAFTVENLARVVLGADLLIPFLPGTDGAGRFLRHGALPILLAILWLEPEARDAWLALHERGARKFATDHDLSHVLSEAEGAVENLGEWLERVENEAWLVPERGIVSGEASVGAFLADTDRVSSYGMLFGGLCLGVSALVAGYGVDWRKWIFQVVNVAYRLPEFGLDEIETWLRSTTGQPLSTDVV
ncbi:MAG TPA: hypothetical protein VJ793_16670 [Anaerolineae bacterium]|nr:hypothetical protein [Anaerolineae bacterium]